VIVFPCLLNRYRHDLPNNLENGLACQAMFPVTLHAVVEHHLDPVNALYAYNDNRQAILPTHRILDGENYTAMDDPAIVGFIAERNELAPFTYSAEDVDRIMDFLNALTDPNTIDLRSDQDVVNGVPSKHPLDD